MRLWFRIDSNNALHIFLNMDCQYNSKLAVACGLIKIPSKRATVDRRLKTISTDIKERISTMGHLFVVGGDRQSFYNSNRQYLDESKG